MLKKDKYLFSKNLLVLKRRNTFFNYRDLKGKIEISICFLFCCLLKKTSMNIYAIHIYIVRKFEIYLYELLK